MRPVSDVLRYMLRRKRGEAKISGVVRRQHTYVRRGCKERDHSSSREGRHKPDSGCEGLCEGEERGRGRHSDTRSPSEDRR